MKIVFKAFSRKIFAKNYAHLKRIMSIYLFIFWGLRIADIRIQIAPFILYLMTTAFTASMMWQALSSESNAADLQHLFMLPFTPRDLALPYVSALGVYTLLTKTAGLLAVVLAVSAWGLPEFLGIILCGISAVLLSACIHFFMHRSRQTNHYPFFVLQKNHFKTVKSAHHNLIWHYLFRYFMAHKNYLTNTVAMWCVACALPLFFRQMEGLFVAPMGFAILSLNTPLCILLSCNPALDQAVRFLPDQKKNFCLPYCLFIFLCNIIADIIFLCSYWFLAGPVTWLMALTALFFALQSAICSVLLEWGYPVRNWKIESDLWHHPRKYVVPAAMLLLAGIVGTVPYIILILIILLGIEIIIFLLPVSAH